MAVNGEYPGDIYELNGSDKLKEVELSGTDCNEYENFFVTNTAG